MRIADRSQKVQVYAGSPQQPQSTIPMPLPTHLLPTTVVGSYPQPDTLIDRAKLSKVVPRTRMTELWRLHGEELRKAQDEATILAVRDMERAGIDIITDGEIRRESYSNYF